MTIQRRFDNYVPALIDAKPLPPVTLTDEEAAVPARIAAVASRLDIGGDPHAPLDHAVASLAYSTAYSAATGMITIGLVVIAWLGGLASFPALVFGGLIVWGCSVLLVLYHNRGQGLHYSQAGIAHKEIEARTEVAKYAIKAHVSLMKHKLNSPPNQ